MSNWKRRRTRKTEFKITASMPNGYVNYFDPVLELPLDDEWEGMIRQIGARRYLVGMIAQIGVRLNKTPDELTDYECHKACRAIIRNCEDYNGSEMRQ